MVKFDPILSAQYTFYPSADNKLDIQKDTFQFEVDLLLVHFHFCELSSGKVCVGKDKRNGYCKSCRSTEFQIKQITKSYIQETFFV